jgi:hypothetical protein
MRLNPRLAPEPPEPRRASIRHERRDEHELRCIMAWRQRSHPDWSQYHESYRVTGPAIRRVK